MTFREMQGLIFNRRVAAIWIVVSLIAVIGGPFGSIAAPIAVRAPYWLALIGLSIVMSLTIITAATTSPRLDWLDARLRPALGALMFAVLYAGVLAVLTPLFFPGATGLGGYVSYLIITAPIALAIAVAFQFFESPADAPPAAGLARFMKRLKPELGADLRRLAMQDHYLEVHTSKGSQLLLMRFTDALEEIEGAPGWRIHRSHWIAEAAIAGFRRENGKPFIISTDGAALPVSRTYLPQLREAGVLKRFGG